MSCLDTRVHAPRPSELGPGNAGASSYSNGGHGIHQMITSDPALTTTSTDPTSMSSRPRAVRPAPPLSAAKSKHATNLERFAENRRTTELDGIPANSPGEFVAQRGRTLQ